MFVLYKENVSWMKLTIKIGSKIILDPYIASMTH